MSSQLLPLELPITALQVEVRQDELRVSVWTERAGLIDLVSVPYTIGIYNKTVRQLANDAFERTRELDMKKFAAGAVVGHGG